MVPRRGIALPSLSDIPVFIAAGKNDPICPAAETDELNQTLLQAGAAVNVHWENYGHQLTRSEVDAASSWFQKNFL
jgi:phospholipase/carboxylesterase